MDIGLPTYHPKLLITAPKIHTDLLWDLSLLFVGLAVVYFLFVFFFRNKLSSKTKGIALKKKELTPMVSEFLFYDPNSAREDQDTYINLKIEIRELLKDRFNRKVLTEILMDLQKDLLGDTLLRLFKLYRDLGLQHDAFAKLKSWRWEVVSQGILELTKLQVPESYSFITKFINDKRGVIRKQAEIATVTLRPEGINYFLDTTRYKISEWQQLKLLDVIRNFEDYQPPSFKAWLTSTNRDVVLFALRLIKYYNQNDAYASITQLVKHKNDQIKSEAIGCIKEFYILEALDTLKGVFWKCRTDIKLLLLDAIATLGKEEDIPFLRLVESRESNFVVRSKALHAINTISPETIMPTQGIQEHLESDSWRTDALAFEIEEGDVPAALDAKDAVMEQEATDEAPKEEPSNASLEHLASPEETPLPVPAEEQILLSPEDLLELEVNGEEITALSLKRPMDEIIQEFDTLPEETEDDRILLDFDFLPLVVPNTQEVEKTHRPKNDAEKEQDVFMDFSVDSWTAIQSLEVSYEEIPSVVEDIGTEQETDLAVQSLEVVYEEVPMTYETVEMVPETPDTHTIEAAVTVEEAEDTAIDFTIDIEKNVRALDLVYEEIIPAREEDLVDIENERDIFLLDFLPLVVEKGESTPIVSDATVSPYSQSVFKQLFLDKGRYSKILLLDTIVDIGDEREIPFLVEITDKESDPFIRDRALEVLNGISERNYRVIDVHGTVLESEDFKGSSIFRQLFWSGDTPSKLMLLEEIEQLGDQKEINFLKTLENFPVREIRERAKRVRTILQAQQEEMSGTEAESGAQRASRTSSLAEGISEIAFELQSMPDARKKEPGFQNSRGHMPLDFCFLLDELNIKPSKAFSVMDVDFALTHEFYKRQMEEEQESGKEGVKNLQKENGEDSLWDILLAFPIKIMEKFNG